MANGGIGHALSDGKFGNDDRTLSIPDNIKWQSETGSRCYEPDHKFVTVPTACQEGFSDMHSTIERVAMMADTLT
jgi:hypothetical protein